MTEIKVARFDEIADGDHRIFACEGKEFGVFRLGDKVVAWENHCPHAGGPVCQGKIFGRVDEPLHDDKRSRGLAYSGRRNIVCPWHGFEFDVETGRHPGDAHVRLKSVPVAVRDGDIVVTLRV